MNIFNTGFNEWYWRHFQHDCALATDVELGCNNNVGGVKDVYAIALEDFLLGTLTVVAGAATVMSNATAKRFRRWKLPRNTAEASFDKQVSQDNGTGPVKLSVKIVANKLSAALNNELTAAISMRLVFVVVDRNSTGGGWLYGRECGMTGKSLKGLHGKGSGDRNGYDMEFEGDEIEVPVYISKAIVDALVTPGA